MKFPSGYSCEILLVDNDSKDDSFVNLQKKWGDFKNIKFLKSPHNNGYGQGNELAIQNARGEYFAIVNPDIEITQGIFDGLIKYMDQHKEIGIIAPRIYYPDGTTQDSFRSFPTIADLFIKRLPFLSKIFHQRLAKFLMWDVDFSVPIEVDWVVGAFFVARKKAWDRIGGFDPRYFLFFEDADICREMWQQNWKVVFHPHYSVIHNHSRLSATDSWWDFFRKPTVKMHIISACKYFWKWKTK